MTLLNPLYKLGPSASELVTDSCTKSYCRGFTFGLFQSTTANKIDSEHTQDYKRLLSVCRLKYYKTKSIEMKFSNPIMLISDNFWLKVTKIAKKGT